MLEKYDAVYSTYTSQLDDTRLPLFIEALIKSKPVSFQQKVYIIKCIRMTADETIIVLKVFQNENKIKSSHVV